VHGTREPLRGRSWFCKRGFPANLPQRIGIASAIVINVWVTLEMIRWRRSAEDFVNFVIFSLALEPDPETLIAMTSSSSDGKTPSRCSRS
jgi:hypothetical protein